jgi:cytochrome c oxidase assembly factor CtaG
MLIFIIAIIVLYLLVINFKLNKQSVYFFTGLFIIILATASPLHFLGMHYLFSAHMTIHIMLLLLAAPLIVLSIPPENRFKKVLSIFSKKIHTAFFLCWITGVGIMWVWHVPSIYNYVFSMKMDHPFINVLPDVHSISLLIAGMLFSWPVIGPYAHYRINPLSGILYLVSACVFCSLLGLLITFAPEGLYTHHLGLNNGDYTSMLIKNNLGISSAMDQQIAGLIMWVPCCFVYLAGCMFLLKRWYNQKEEIPTLSPIQPIQL